MRRRDFILALASFRHSRALIPFASGVAAWSSHRSSPVIRSCFPRSRRIRRSAVRMVVRHRLAELARWQPARFPDDVLPRAYRHRRGQPGIAPQSVSCSRRAAIADPQQRWLSACA